MRLKAKKKRMAQGYEAPNLRRKGNSRLRGSRPERKGIMKTNLKAYRKETNFELQTSNDEDCTSRLKERNMP